MGFMKWLARRGNVGGTARWAATSYKFFRQRHPDVNEFSDSDIYRLMIVQRYEAFPDPEAQKFLLDQATQSKGLNRLVTAVLCWEADFFQNTKETQNMFYEVIDEELRKQGIPEDAI